MGVEFHQDGGAGKLRIRNDQTGSELMTIDPVSKQITIPGAATLVGGVPSGAAITSAAGASSGISVVTVQLQGAAGDVTPAGNFPAVTRCGCFLSDANPPTATTATAASAGFNSASVGFLELTGQAVTKSCPIITNSAGLATFQVTDSAKTAYFINVVLPNGTVVTSPTTLTYHA